MDEFNIPIRIQEQTANIVIYKSKVLTLAVSLLLKKQTLDHGLHSW